MKHFIILAIFIASAASLSAQCTGADSITKKYLKDADRLSLRRTFKTGSTWKDSIKINRTLTQSYLRPLIAVYNATNIPARDTVVKLLNIHTGPVPEMNFIAVKAPGNLSWMDSLSKSKFPTGQYYVDNLILNYKLQNWSYSQSVGYDQVVFRADSSFNIIALASSFTTIAGVIAAEPVTSLNNTREITDSVGTGFTELTYMYAWGTCENGCDYKAYWKFKILADCSVEYKGTSGNPLNTGLAEIRTEKTGVYPNPAYSYIIIETEQKESAFRILNVTGMTVKNGKLDEQQRIDVEELPSGLYFIELKSGGSTNTIKIIKN